MVNAWLPVLADKYSSITTNGEKTVPLRVFETMLRPVLSVDGTYASVNANGSLVAADVVALDSALPLKRRGSLGAMRGEINKIGLKYRKTESDIDKINILKARGATEGQIVAALFDDYPRVIGGIKERIEAMFLEGFSTGTVLVSEDKTVGTGIRVNYGYPDENKFYASKTWSDTSATPIADLEDAIDKAFEKGYTITDIYLSKSTFNLLRNSQEGKVLYANFLGLRGGDVKGLIAGPSNKFIEAFESEHSITLHPINRTVRIEKDGKQTAYRPFKNNVCVLTTTSTVGRLVYGMLAEDTNRVSGVTYQKVDNYILTSMYGEVDPLSETTAGQAKAVPVVDGVDGIFLQEATAQSAE